MAEDLNVIVATDCGSTTTKAILIEKQGEVYRQTYRGESPTTVEAPFEDVTRGVLNAFTELEELSGRRLLEGERLLMPAKDGTGTDLYVSTSSAGGGLQMLVAGVVLSMTAESAQRCALCAGAIVIDALASNDRRLPHEKIERIRVCWERLELQFEFVDCIARDLRFGVRPRTRNVRDDRPPPFLFQLPVKLKSLVQSHRFASIRGHTQPCPRAY